MVIEDRNRGIEYHLELTKDNKIKKMEVIFAVPRNFSCVFRPEALFSMCGVGRVAQHHGQKDMISK